MYDYINDAIFAHERFVEKLQGAEDYRLAHRTQTQQSDLVNCLREKLTIWKVVVIQPHIIMSKVQGVKVVYYPINEAQSARNCLNDKLRDAEHHRLTQLVKS